MTIFRKLILGTSKRVTNPIQLSFNNFKAPPLVNNQKHTFFWLFWFSIDFIGIITRLFLRVNDRTCHCPVIPFCSSEDLSSEPINVFLINDSCHIVQVHTFLLRLIVFLLFIFAFSNYTNS